MPEDGDAVGIFIRERPQEQRVRDAEDRGVRPDTEGERCDGNRGEGRLGREDAKSVTEVMPPRFHGAPDLVY